MELFTAEQSRRLDSGTILGHDVPSLELMENAAMALACEAERQARGSSAAVFFGSGNNGGDGAAAARILAGKGWSVRAFSLETEKSLRTIAARWSGKWRAPAFAQKPVGAERERTNFFTAAAL